MRAVVLADTHLHPGSRRRLPDQVMVELERADVVLHAGDILTGDVLELLAGYAPVHAVLGNNDDELAGLLPERLSIDLDGVAVGMVHDSGPRRGREARLRRSFPRSALVVFGHSHIPWNTEGVDGHWLLNPGSPIDKRAQAHPTIATVDVADGQIVGIEIIELG